MVSEAVGPAMENWPSLSFPSWSDFGCWVRRRA